MFSYTLLIALVVCFLLVIVMNAWFVRRFSNLRGRTREKKVDYERLHAEATAMADELIESRRGLESNAVSIKALEAEIEGFRERIGAFLQEHEELAGDYRELIATSAVTTPSTGPSDDEQKA